MATFVWYSNREQLQLKPGGQETCFYHLALSREDLPILALSLIEHISGLVEKGGYVEGLCLVKFTQHCWQQGGEAEERTEVPVAGGAE